MKYISFDGQRGLKFDKEVNKFLENNDIEIISHSSNNYIVGYSTYQHVSIIYKNN